MQYQGIPDIVAYYYFQSKVNYYYSVIIASIRHKTRSLRESYNNGERMNAICDKHCYHLIFLFVLKI